MRSRPKGVLRETLAANLLRIRRALGHSQDAFADLLKIQRSYYGAVEREERNVSIDRVEQIARALQIEPWQLLTPRDEKE